MKQYSQLAIPSTLLIILLVGFPQISETIYSPALPDIATSLKTSNHLVQWTLSVYFIGFALGVFYWGRVSDKIGRRPIMLIGIIVYGIGSLSCFFSPSIDWLLASRVIQAFGASVGSVITQAIVREAFNEKSRLKMFSTIGMALAVAPALGPILGGYINQWINWQANFALLVLMSIGLLIYAYFSLPETRVKELQQQHYSISYVLMLLIKDKRVWGCALLIGMINGILFSFYAEGPFIFINIIGITPGQYGWMGIFIAVAVMSGSALSRRLNHIMSTNSIILLGCIIAVFSALLLLASVFSGLVQKSHTVRSILLIILPIAGIIFGEFGLIIPIIIGTALKKYHAILGTAGSLFGLSYYAFLSFFTWMMGMLHSGNIYSLPMYFFALTLGILLVFLVFVRSQD